MSRSDDNLSATANRAQNQWAEREGHHHASAAEKAVGQAFQPAKSTLWRHSQTRKSRSGRQECLPHMLVAMATAVTVIPMRHNTTDISRGDSSWDPSVRRVVGLRSVRPSCFGSIGSPKCAASARCGVPPRCDERRAPITSGSSEVEQETGVISDSVRGWRRKR